MAHMNQEKKRRIAHELRDAIPKGWKWTLRVDRYSIYLTIKSAPVDLLAAVDNPSAKAQGYWDVNKYHIETHFFDGEIKEQMVKILKAIDIENYDRSDSMSDYFDVGYYSHIKIGDWKKKFVFTDVPVATG